MYTRSYAWRLIIVHQKPSAAAVVEKVFTKKKKKDSSPRPHEIRLDATLSGFLREL